MAELPRTAPLDGFADAFARLPGAVRITAEPWVAMADVRVDPVPPDLGLPTEPNTWRPAGAGRAVWLGPDEWLVTDGTVAPEELDARLRAVVRPAGGTVVDVSAQRTTIRLGGAHARDVLEKGCAIDLHPRAFPAGSCAQTTLGRAGVVLLALEGDEYALLVRSSFAGYLAEWLLDAALEFTALEPTALESTA
jgi:sarcosine oxidase subunit gamma